MTSKEALYALSSLRRRYFVLRLTEMIFLSAGAGLLIHTLAQVFISNKVIDIALSASGAFIIFFIKILQYRLHRLNYHFFTSYLNQHYTQLHESADLLLTDETKLSAIQLLQKRKTLHAVDSIFPLVKLPHRIFQSMAVLALGFFVYILSSSFAVLTPIEKSSSENKEIKPGSASVFVKSLSIVVSPPAYTQIRSFESGGFDLTIAEGSTVLWQGQFSGEPNAVKMFFSGRDSVNLDRIENQTYTVKRTVNESGFYQLQWTRQNKTYRSDFYKVEVIKDQPPRVSIKNLEQFTKLKFTDPLGIQLKSDLSDDYGLTDAQIVATVSKGSGEGVKFREEKLKFITPQKIEGRKTEATSILDLKKLGLDPGDELYFYVEAWDNKMPLPNHNRTETFFIALQDTATEIASVDAGLGVDLMPEYFRSQRQIIIDTEKLLRDKSRISKKEFNSTSNELGYDQKVLRLRYGQFLGLEDEAGIGQPDDDHEEDGKEEKDITKQLGHQHDTKNEHNLVDTKNQKHDHKGETKDPDEKEDPMKEFVHNHDDTEEATFFIQSIKTKLKAAVTEMWDAELYLRLYQPEKSLPYQYRALNLLKEISNDSRIYVHRSGFDPPPLKEEKRLTADLSEVKTKSSVSRIESKKNYPAIREALSATERLLTDKTSAISKENQKIFNKAGQELAALAIEQPGYLKGLSILKSLSEQVLPDSIALVTLRKTLWLALPKESSSPNQQQGVMHSLNQQFLQRLEK